MKLKCGQGQTHTIVELSCQGGTGGKHITKVGPNLNHCVFHFLSKFLSFCNFLMKIQIKIYILAKFHPIWRGSVLCYHHGTRIFLEQDCSLSGSKNQCHRSYHHGSKHNKQSVLLLPRWHQNTVSIFECFQNTIMGP